jgi:hypothetical protein
MVHGSWLMAHGSWHGSGLMVHSSWEMHFVTFDSTLLRQAKPNDQMTKSPNHQMTKSPNHQITISPNHPPHDSTG